MGCCGSAEDASENKAVQQELNQSAREDKKEKKLLLLGTGGSGKSTFFKQLQNIHGGGFENRDRQGYKGQVFEQIIEAMKTMVVRCEEFFEDDEKEYAHLQLAPESEKSSEYLLSVRANSALNGDIVSAMHVLWKDPAIQAIWEMRNQICIPDSTSHFLNKLDDISADGWTPSDEDLLLVRYRTTGMAEKKFMISGTLFRVVDVGGQRNERRKWIHFFDSVTAVLFVSSLSSYDEVVFEDESTNSMHEALKVFDEYANSIIFEETAFILFLNKKDLFEEKVPKVPITVCFPDYTGPQMIEPSLEYVKGQFEDLNRNQGDREIYTHVTQATDPQNAEKVFNDVQHIVIQFSLQQSGLTGGTVM